MKFEGRSKADPKNLGSQIPSDADLYEDTRASDSMELRYFTRMERISNLKAEMLLAKLGVRVLREAAPEVEPVAEGEA